MDAFQLEHHLREVRWQQRLRAVAERLFRVAMGLHQHAVRADGDRRAGHGHDQVAAARAMARVHQHRQMGERLGGGDDAEIQRVPRVIGPGADAALAKRHLPVALAQDVLGGIEPLFERRGRAALEQHGLGATARPAQQREILHVPRTDLDHVGGFFHRVEGLHIQRLGDDAEAEFLPRFHQQAQAFEAEALERVRTGAGLEGPGAEQLHACIRHIARDGEELLAAFHAARPGDEGEIAAADADAVHLHHGASHGSVQAGQLEGARDGDDFENARHRADLLRAERLRGIRGQDAGCIFRPGHLWPDAALPEQGQDAVHLA